jgi:hypothetical protein
MKWQCSVQRISENAQTRIEGLDEMEASGRRAHLGSVPLLPEPERQLGGTVLRSSGRQVLSDPMSGYSPLRSSPLSSLEPQAKLSRYRPMPTKAMKEFAASRLHWRPSPGRARLEGKRTPHTRSRNRIPQRPPTKLRRDKTSLSFADRPSSFTSIWCLRPSRYSFSDT